MPVYHLPGTEGKDSVSNITKINSKIKNPPRPNCIGRGGQSLWMVSKGALITGLSTDWTACYKLIFIAYPGLSGGTVYELHYVFKKGTNSF